LKQQKNQKWSNTGVNLLFSMKHEAKHTDFTISTRTPESLSIRGSLGGRPTGRFTGAGSP
jgi:hypothetical protein